MSASPPCRLTFTDGSAVVRRGDAPVRCLDGGGTWRRVARVERLPPVRAGGGGRRKGES